MIFDSNFNPAEANNLLVSNQWRFALQQNATYQNGVVKAVKVRGVTFSPIFLDT